MAGDSKSGKPGEVEQVKAGSDGKAPAVLTPEDSSIRTILGPTAVKLLEAGEHYIAKLFGKTESVSIEGQKPDLPKAIKNLKDLGNAGVFQDLDRLTGDTGRLTEHKLSQLKLSSGGEYLDNLKQNFKKLAHTPGDPNVLIRSELDGVALDPAVRKSLDAVMGNQNKLDKNEIARLADVYKKELKDQDNFSALKDSSKSKFDELAAKYGVEKSPDAVSVMALREMDPAKLGQPLADTVRALRDFSFQMRGGTEIRKSDIEAAINERQTRLDKESSKILREIGADSLKSLKGLLDNFDTVKDAMPAAKEISLKALEKESKEGLSPQARFLLDNKDRLDPQGTGVITKNALANLEVPGMSPGTRAYRDQQVKDYDTVLSNFDKIQNQGKRDSGLGISFDDWKKAQHEAISQVLVATVLGGKDASSPKFSPELKELLHDMDLSKEETEKINQTLEAKGSPFRFKLDYQSAMSDMLPGRGSTWSDIVIIKPNNVADDTVVDRLTYQSNSWH